MCSAFEKQGSRLFDLPNITSSVYSTVRTWTRLSDRTQVLSLLLSALLQRPVMNHRIKSFSLWYMIQSRIILLEAGSWWNRRHVAFGLRLSWMLVSALLLICCGTWGQLLHLPAAVVCVHKNVSEAHLPSEFQWARGEDSHKAHGPYWVLSQQRGWQWHGYGQGC